MPLYVTVSEGPRADRTQPVLAVSDPQIVAAVMREIGKLAEREPVEREQTDPSLGLPRTRPTLVPMRESGR